MNYELAKELKDAGFPQNSAFVIHLCKTGGDTFELTRLRTTPLADYEIIDTVDAPTLSELIEACDGAYKLRNPGYQFVLRSAIEDPEGSGVRRMWFAALISSSYEQYEGEGPAPDIAVARLWLALNKKV